MQRYRKVATEKLLQESRERRQFSPTNSEWQEMSKDQESLMALGIEIDAELLDRLKTLSSGSIFGGLGGAAAVVAERQRGVSSPSLFFSSPGRHSELSELSSAPSPVSRPLFSHSLMSCSDLENMEVEHEFLSRQADCLLRELSHLESQTFRSMPQLKPKIERIISTLGERFHRNPERFCALVSKCCQGHRYLRSVEFQRAMRVILKPDSTRTAHGMEEVLSALFVYISDTLPFEGHIGHPVVDMWKLLHVLSNSSVNGRRSFERNILTRTAVINEFWHREVDGKQSVFERIPASKPSLSPNSSRVRRSQQEFSSVAQALSSPTLSVYESPRRAGAPESAMKALLTD